MVGITGYGVYVPKCRVTKESMMSAFMQPELAKLAGGMFGNKERSVCGWDEDTVTMAAEAVLNAMEHSQVSPKEIGIVYFASVSSPYAEKSIAPFLALLAKIPSEGLRATDFGGSTRAVTMALRAAIDAINAGEVKYAMVVASDARIGFLGEMSEQTSGDAAVAVILGKENTIADIEGFASVTEEFTEIWKGKDDTYLRSYDARFTREKGYFRFINDTVKLLMGKTGKKADDFQYAVLEPTNAELDPLRRAEDLAPKIGFKRQTKNFSGLIQKIGSPGNAAILLGLADILDAAKPKERVVCASYAAGSDAFSVVTSDNIEKKRNKKTVKAYLNSKLNVDYVKYLEWRDVIKPTSDKFEGAWSSLPMLWRQLYMNWHLEGGKCKKCGIITFPQRRICYECGAADGFEPYPFSRDGKIVTYCVEMYVGPEIEAPLGYGVVECSSGGRLFIQIVEAEFNKGDMIKGLKLEIGMPVEMVIRKVSRSMGLDNYGWKSRVVRLAESAPGQSAGG